MNKVYKAQVFATAAHAAIGQTRDSGEDYIVHPEAVVSLLQSIPHNEDMLATAWLHDVVEDTQIGLGLIEKEFGEKVALMVEKLSRTRHDSHCELNKDELKELDNIKLSTANSDVHNIKMADIIHNLKSIGNKKSNNVQSYLNAKKIQVECLHLAHPKLIEIAQQIFNEIENKT